MLGWESSFNEDDEERNVRFEMLFDKSFVGRMRKGKVF
jgi:hypothetical protein